MKTLDPLSGIAAFLAVTEDLSFSKAAQKLNVSRATVSSQLQELERRLGTRLLHRSTRNVTLTEAGAAYHAAIRGIMPQIQEAERAALFFQRERAGRLRIIVAPDLAPNHIAPVVAQFLVDNPAISIEMELSNSAVNLIEHGFDLGIRGAIAVEQNLIARQIGTSPILLCASPSYLEKHGVPKHPEDLSQHACLHFAPLRWGRAWEFEKDGAIVRIPIIPRFEIDDGFSLCRAAVCGAGITLLPAFVVGDDIRAGRLVPILPEWKIVFMPVLAVYPANRLIAVKVRHFVSYLIDHLAESPDLHEAPYGRAT